MVSNQFSDILLISQGHANRKLLSQAMNQSKEKFTIYLRENH